MEHYTLPGQTEAEAQLRAAAKRNALSHAILLTGNGDRLAVARFAAAAMECESAGAARSARTSIPTSPSSGTTRIKTSPWT